MLYQLYSTFISKRTIGTGAFLDSFVTCFIVALIGGLCAQKYKKYFRFSMFLWFITTAVAEVVMLNVDTGNPFYVQRGVFEGWFSLTYKYVIVSTCLAYCEFQYSFLLLTPVYLTATYFLTWRGNESYEFEF